MPVTYKTPALLPFPTGQDSCKYFLSLVKQSRLKSLSVAKMKLSSCEN